VISDFQFHSYKIDSTTFQMRKDIGVLLVPLFNANGWAINFDFRRPQYFKANSLYIAGMDCQIYWYDDSIKPEDRKPELATLVLTMGISGCFSSKGQFAPDLEDNLVRMHIPTLLMPYLRGAVSTFLSSAGYGTLIFPLINIAELAKKHLASTTIEIVG
jgi:hypothetical protein